MPSAPGETRGDGVTDMISLALKLMEKDKGEKDNADNRLRSGQQSIISIMILGETITSVSVSAVIGIID